MQPPRRYSPDRAASVDRVIRDFHPARRLSAARWLVVALLAINFGCNRPEEITSYQAPKDDFGPHRSKSAESGEAATSGSVATAPAAADDTSSPSRMLAAVVTQQQKVWFFKLTGDPDQVGPQVKPFRALIQSLQFEGDTPQWEVPEGWTAQAGSGMRYATINAGQPGLDLSVIALPAPQEILSNVNRWRNQLQLPAINQDELKDSVETIKLTGAEAALVDIQGQMSAAGTGMPPFMAGSSAQPTAEQPTASPEPMGAFQPGFEFTQPVGWKPGKPGPMRKLAFDVSDGKAELTVTTLGAAGADLLPNVNRWRAQLGLVETTSDELKQSLEELKVGNGVAPYVDLRAAGSAAPQATLAAVLVRDETAWFFKLMGDASTVDAEKANFESFVQSVRFDE